MSVRALAVVITISAFSGVAQAQPATPTSVPPAQVVTPTPSTDAPQVPSDPAGTPPTPSAATGDATPRASASPSDTDDIEAALAKDQAVSSSSPASAPPSVPATGGGVQSLNPDISLIAGFAAAAFSNGERLQGGAHDPAQNGFNLQALELSLAAAVDPYFRFDSHIALELDGIDVEEAYGTTLGLPFKLQARLGQFLNRFGRINATHPHAWTFVDQPFALSRVFGGEGNKGLGAELSWLTPLPWYVELVGSSMMATGDESHRSFLGATERTVRGPQDLLLFAAAKQFFPLSDDWSLAWGLSGAFGPNPSGPGNRSAIYGSDVYLKYRPLATESPIVVSLTSEWFYRRRQVPHDIAQDVSSYSELFFRFAQRWAAAGRYEYGSAPFGVHAEAPTDALDADWTGSRQRAALLLTHYPSEFSRFRLQVSRDMPSFGDAIWAGFLTAELAIGAHGAHTF